jgi:hypothetical protein
MGRTGTEQIEAIPKRIFVDRPGWTTWGSVVGGPPAGLLTTAAPAPETSSPLTVSGTFPVFVTTTLNATTAVAPPGETRPPV